MKQALFLAVFAGFALTGIYTVITVYDSTLIAGRMHQTPVVRPHEEPQPLMDKRTIPFLKSETLLHEKLNRNLSVVLPGSSEAALAKGETEYKTFCSHCHGPRLDGLGTVGQSFFPLPANLTSEKTANLTDQQLFSIISYGSAKTPALASSMSVESRYAVIQYIRSVQKTAR